jgi:serine phosphatase RsbU (regulator of sigma subunit)
VRKRRGGRDIGVALRWLPALLIVAGVVFDLLTPVVYTASPLFAAAPMVASPLLRIRTTVAAGLAACAATVALTAYHGLLFQREPLAEIATVATVSALAVVTTHLASRGERQLRFMRSIAAAAQSAVLPHPPARLPGLTIAARYIAAQSDAQIGGDLYAIQDTPYGVRLIVGDVRGKGMSAVEGVAVIVGAFREAAEQEPDLGALADGLGRSFERAAERLPDDLERTEGFVTAVLVELPSDAANPSDYVRVVNRGHPPPLVVHPDGCVTRIDPTRADLPLGMSSLAQWPDVIDKADLPPGSTLLLYTDGVTEARDHAGRFYDPEARLTGRLFPGPEALLDALLVDIGRHTGGGHADDMALLAITRR